MGSLIIIAQTARLAFLAGYVVLIIHGQPWWGLPCLCAAILGFGVVPLKKIPAHQERRP
jgi:uncharacterized membrane protein YccC